MIIAITGATGFVGKRLADYHLKSGDEVRYLTRTNSQAIDGAVPYLGDVNSPAEVLLPFLSGVDVLYHCAAEIKNEAAMHDTNVKGTQHLFNLAIGHVKHWVQLSSTGVYGNQPNTLVTEETAPKPDNAYEISKLTADNMLIGEALQHDVTLSIVRPSNIYGTTMTNQSLFGLIRMIHAGVFFFIGKKGAITNYIHVDNVVHAMVLVAQVKHKSNPGIYIVSDYCAIEDFVKFIANTLDVKLPKVRLPEFFVRCLVSIAEQLKITPLTTSRVDALTRTTIYSSNKIMQELGYKHQVKMEQGITELAEFWRDRK